MPPKGQVFVFKGVSSKATKSAKDVTKQNFKVHGMRYQLPWLIDKELSLH
jgi:hypothetical protein